MRDPKRIERVLSLIEVLWKRNPDLRLGQLVCNLALRDENVFYLEDDKLEQKIIKELGK